MAARKPVPAKKRGAGRPTDLNEKVMLQLFDWVSDGKTIKWCAMKLGVARYTIYRWIKQFPEFKEMMEEAAMIKAQNYVDELIEIADDDSKDLIIDENGNIKPNAANVARSKLKMAARQKVAGYLAPRLFGENATKVDITTNGDAVFMGLVITPPKMDDDDEEEDIIDVD